MSYLSMSTLPTFLKSTTTEHFYGDVGSKSVQAMVFEYRFITLALGTISSTFTDIKTHTSPPSPEWNPSHTFPIFLGLLSAHASKRFAFFLFRNFFWFLSHLSVCITLFSLFSFSLISIKIKQPLLRYGNKTVT